MNEGARRRAEACFAVARSSTFVGERAAAISRGEAIAKAAGLPLDGFDIPGRDRSRAAPGERLIDGGPYGGFVYARTVIVDDDLFAAVVDEIFRRQS